MDEIKLVRKKLKRMKLKICKSKVIFTSANLLKLYVTDMIYLIRIAILIA